MRSLSRWVPRLWAALVIGWFAWFGLSMARAPGFRALAVPDEGFTLPLLPVTVRVMDETAPGASGDGFCGSELFRDVLRRRTFLWLDGDAAVSWPADFTLECSEIGDDLRLVFAWPDGRKIYGTTYTRVDGSAGDELAARQIARRLAKMPAVAAAGAVAVMAANQNRFAEQGMLKLNGGDDDEAAQLLHLALESNLDDAALYYGLAEACARQGLADQAYWYFSAYLETTNKEPDDAVEQVDAVMGGMPETPARASRADEIIGRWRAAQAAQNWNDALAYQKALVLETPWDEDLYAGTKAVYEEVGWKALARNWSARLDLARLVNRNKARLRRLQEMVNPS